MKKLILAIIFLLFSSVCHADTKTGLLSRWKIDESSGSSISDIGSLGVALTAFNSPTWISGRINRALSFNNASSQYMSTASSLTIGTNIITVSFWLNSSYAVTDGTAVESSVNFNSNTNSIFIDTKAGSTTGSCTAGNFSAAMRGTTGSRQTCVAPPSSGWHLFTIVFNASTSAGDIKIYLDGALPTQIGGSNTKTGTSNFSSYTWYFMSRGGASLFTNGSIDDIRIYNRELSASDALELYNQGFYGHKINNAVIRNAVIQ